MSKTSAGCQNVILPEPFWRLPDENNRLAVPSVNFSTLSVSLLLLILARVPTEIYKCVCLAICEKRFVY